MGTFDSHAGNGNDTCSCIGILGKYNSGHAHVTTIKTRVYMHTYGYRSAAGCTSVSSKRSPTTLRLPDVLAAHETLPSKTRSTDGAVDSISIPSKWSPAALSFFSALAAHETSRARLFSQQSEIRAKRKLARLVKPVKHDRGRVYC